MKLRTVLMVLVLAAFATFTVANWNAITAPTTLSFVVGRVEAPLGLLLLGFTVLIAALFLLLLAFQQATVIIETRRTAKELSAQRALADEAEASRFTALRQHLDEVLQRLETQGAARQDTLVQQLERMQHEMDARIEQSGNAIAAHIGVVDERVERLAGGKELAPPPA